jgi:hypothetical protein
MNDNHALLLESLSSHIAADGAGSVLRAVAEILATYASLLHEEGDNPETAYIYGHYACECDDLADQLKHNGI